MKKIVCALLAVVMLVALSTAAFAAEGEEKYPANLTGHTYTAFQIFSGTQAEGSDKLGNVEWGDGVDGAALLTALQADEIFGKGEENIFADCTTAAEVAEAMSGYADKSEQAKEFAQLAYANKKGEGEVVTNGETELDAGYYLVVDTTESVPAVEGGDPVYNVALLQLTQKGTFAIETKVGVPSVKKEVTDDNHGLTCKETAEDHVHTKACYNWKDANEVALGDTVNFKVTGEIPASAVEYKTFFFVLGDTMSKGLTYTEDSMKIYIGDKEATAAQYTVNGPTTDATTGKTSFQVAIVDAKDYAGKTVVIAYAATLNEDAIIGSTGNINEADITYSNKPNYDYEGDPDHPGFPAEEDSPYTSVTPKDITVTFVTGIKVYKVDDNNQPLQGAEFTLTGNGLNVVLMSKEVFKKVAEGQTAEYYALKNGKYTKDAPVTADYMKKTNSTTQGYVVAEADYAGTDKVTVNDVAYRAYKPAEDAGKEVYILVRANSADYAETTPSYVKEWELEAKTKAENVDIKCFVDDAGVATFVGLCAGDYTLTESVVPAGFNPIKPIDFTIECDLPDEVTTGEETCTWSGKLKDGTELTWDGDKGVLSFTVVNQQGSTLPETGGIGTTIFYVVGSALVVVAAVLLITKKRMHNDA